MKTSATRHVFDHLGQPPYRFLHHEAKTYQACPGAPIQVGGSCDHCATGIIDMFHFEASDGKRFKVGSTCVKKAGDAGVWNQIKSEVNRIKRDRKREKDLARIAAAKEIYTDEVRAAFSKRPHPYSTEWTLADYVDWMLEHAGIAGMVRAASAIEKEAAK